MRTGKKLQAEEKIKQLTSGHQRHITSNKENRTVWNNEVKLKMWKKYFESLLNEESCVGQRDKWKRG